MLSDDKKAIMAMVDHLVDEHNAKRIYYLSGPSYMHDIRMREDGFRERMKSRGVAFRVEYIFKGNLWYNIGKEAVDYFFHWMMKDLMQFYVPMIIWQFLYVRNCAIEDSVYRRILL